MLIPVLIVMFRKIRWHYRIADWQLALDMYERPKLPPPNIMVMPISGVNRAVVMALDYARERGQGVVVFAAFRHVGAQRVDRDEHDDRVFRHDRARERRARRKAAAIAKPIF